MLRCSYTIPCVGRNSSVGIATRYGMDVSGIESRWGRDFGTPPGARLVSYKTGTVSFLGVERPRRVVNRPPTSSDEVKGRVELCLYSPSGPSWPLVGWTKKYIIVRLFITIIIIMHAKVTN
jgi:hypothetical protein